MDPKNSCMLLKIGKTTPRCLKQLPGDEYTGEFGTNSRSGLLKKNFLWQMDQEVKTP
jgi:hypothetical protein